MQLQFYYNEIILKYILAFADVFNGVSVGVYNQTNNIYTTKKVPIITPNHDKYFDMYNNLHHNSISVNPNVKLEFSKSLPIMSITDLNLQYDSNRQVSPLNILYNNTNHTYMPVPYTLSLNLNINTSKYNDLFQIIEQILPLFSPQFAINIKPFEMCDSSISVPIVITSNSTIFPTDIQEHDENIYKHTIGFTMPIYIFGNIKSDINYTKTIEFNTIKL